MLTLTGDCLTKVKVNLSPFKFIAKKFKWVLVFFYEQLKF